MVSHKSSIWFALPWAVIAANVALASQGIGLSTTQQQVGRYEKIEMLIDAGRAYSNPFDPCEVEVNLVVTSPSGRSLVLPAFFGQDYERQDLQRSGKTMAWCYPRGDGSWKARFAPTETGTYTARASLRDRSGERSSEPVRFECVTSSRKGFLRAGRSDPRFLEFTEGQPFFAVGQNLAFIGEGQYVTLPKAEEIFGKLAANGANFVRLWTCCQDWALAIEARKNAWTRSWTKESPIVSMPGGKAQSRPRNCVKVEGQDGTSITANPSHSVALQPGTNYVLSGRLKMDGPEAVRVQVGGKEWKVLAGSEWQAFEEGFTTGTDEYWLGRVAFSLVGEGKAWLDQISLKEASGGAELLWEADVNRPIRGRYNPLDCFMLDEIVETAEENGIYLMLCAITRDLYMETLSKVDSPEYRLATADAKKFMRYAVARWGYSTSVAAWEYFNEMDPGKPTDEFYAEVGSYLAQIDIYNHLRTTSTWHPSARDCRHPQLDIAQEHHYMRPDDDDFRDEVESILRQSRWLREQAPSKPALIGEFGLATAQWGRSEYMKQDLEGVHFHNCLWASALGGTSGTAMFWWWEVLDQQDAYRHYKPLARFLANVAPAGLQPVQATTSESRLRIMGRQDNRRALLWLANHGTRWWNLVAQKREPTPIDTATVTVQGLNPGLYTILWWDTWQGEPVSRHTTSADAGGLQLVVPPFTRDLACKIMPATFAD